MSRGLIISVRYHDGRYHGTGDWPPAPARLFQALVAAAPKDKGVLEKASRDALAWLEQLAAPVIAAPPKHEGQHVSLFVPNNDLDVKGGDIRRVAEVRSATKKIKPLLFDASVPLLYVWRFDGDDTHAKRICEIADGLYQLGRGVDMAWAVAEVLDEEAEVEKRLAECYSAIYRPSEKGNGVALDCPEGGSLESLEIRYKAGAQRFRRVVEGKSVRTEFANAPKPRFRSVAYNSPATRLLFDLRRTTDSGSPFAPWPLRQVAALVQKLRDGAAAKLKKLNRSVPLDEGTINKALVGRDTTEADKALRLRIAPLPSIGHVHADRGIRRVLVEVPPDCPIRADDVAWAFSGLEVVPQEVDTETGEIVSSLVELVAADDDSMLAHYGIGDDVSSRLWRSVTPLALPKSAARRRINPAKRGEQAKNGAERLAEQQRACHEVAQALRHAGLRYRISSLRVQREPFEAKGERGEAFAHETRFSKHQLWHVEIEFTEPVNGPILLGSGRYLGLGLMKPARKAEGVLSFAVVDGLAANVDPIELARALRRAVMARVQVTLGKSNSPLPLFFTGHELNGDPARGNGHQHLAFIADLPRRRLLVVAPHMMEHREPTRDEKEYLSVLAVSLTRLTELRAGAAGKLELLPSVVHADDPLLAPARTWESATSYRVTRHPKETKGRDTLVADASVELARRNLPKPLRIESTQCEAGAHGGISGRLRIEFSTAVSGPILIGQTCHSGGGLFAVVKPR
jgi:CRISPR-associated protein Csb2